MTTGWAGNDTRSSLARGPAFSRRRAGDGRRPAALAAGLPGLRADGRAHPRRAGRPDRAAERFGAPRSLPGLPLAAGLGPPLPEVLRPALRGLRTADGELLHHALRDLRSRLPGG